MKDKALAFASRVAGGDAQADQDSGDAQVDQELGADLSLHDVNHVRGTAGCADTGVSVGAPIELTSDQLQHEVAPQTLEEQIAAMQLALAARDAKIAARDAKIAARDAKIAALISQHKRVLEGLKSMDVSSHALGERGGFEGAGGMCTQPASQGGLIDGHLGFVGMALMKPKR